MGTTWQASNTGRAHRRGWERNAIQIVRNVLEPEGCKEGSPVSSCAGLCFWTRDDSHAGRDTTMLRTAAANPPATSSGMIRPDHLSRGTIAYKSVCILVGT